NRLTADVHDAAREPEEHRSQHHHADKAELLADHREQEVGVRLGQPVELLDAATETDTEDLAAPEGDERMRELIPLAERMLLAPRVEVGKDALAPPFGKTDHHGEGHEQDGRDQEKHPRVDAT